ncbi:MAG: hypothetical protein LBV69_08200 [Bacteroidales bacterium]|jgi:hypothetical protein|nr:hypothetical protein [Bacteroidales bacterium]
MNDGYSHFSSKVYLIIIFLFSIISIGCNNNKLKKNVSNINVNITIERFDLELNTIKNGNEIEKIVNLQEKYNNFFEIYIEKIINIGNTDNVSFITYLNLFLNDYAEIQANKEVAAVFSKVNNIEKELNDGFKYLKYYYPNYEIPRIVTFTSGFNHSVVILNDFIGIGLDKYLGEDCKLYEMLNIEKYLRFEMSPEFINIDIMQIIAEDLFPNNIENKNLLSEIIYNGKILYFINAMYPNIQDFRLNKYSKYQIEYCKKFEKDIWTGLIEQKLLFNTDVFTIRKLTQKSPYTTQFGPDCPARIVNWIGLQIVRSYMNNNADVTLQKLMEEKDFQKILQLSQY